MIKMIKTLREGVTWKDHTASSDEGRPKETKIQVGERSLPCALSSKTRDGHNRSGEFYPELL